MPNGLVGIGRKNRLGLIGHFIIDKMSLVLHHFAARQMGLRDHGLCHF